ncbi:ATP-binding protein, partial [Kitasatospora sp. NPDC057223]|uniref:ATP-binding protein n=1 Tax=Kitasatospora sp. NPDC057223 TaxID=3346055 RepID=UPI00363E81E5
MQQALRDFAGRLKKLQARAGNPTGPQLVKASAGALNTTVVSELLEGKAGTFRIPPWDRISAFVEACKAHSAGDGFPLDPPLGDIRHWRKAHGDLVEHVEELAGINTGAAPGDAAGHEGSAAAPTEGAGAGTRAGIAKEIGGGTFNGPAILGRTIHVTLPQDAPLAAGLPPLAPPPAVPAGFTGRDEDLEDLLTALNPPTDNGAGAGGWEAAVVVASVLGMGGMGKTTLALAAGHTALQRGLFTGVLFLDLHGYDDTPTDAGHALDGVLRDLGVEPERIPPGTDQRAALYRAQLATRARHGERVLVLADNASAGEQVEHLLPPGDGPHRMLVTSRNDLSPALGARLVDLDVLDPGRAVALMDTALRITLPKDGRIAADPAGAARVAELCGYLPLALRIAAAQLAVNRGLKLADLVGDLEKLEERLDVLDDGTPKAVRAVLERSYRRLPLPQAELFRLLAVNPGPDLSTDTAVAYTGIGKPRDVRTRLTGLAAASLVRQDPDTGRWRMHDLVRAYATEQAQQNPQHSAVARLRLFEYYARTTRAADAHLDPATNGDRKRFAGRGAAMAWLDAERANLVAAVHTAHATGRPGITIDLAGCLGSYLPARRYLQDALAVATLAHEAATSLGDHHSEAGTMNNLGNALQDLRRFDDALQAHQNALDIFRNLGDRHREATARGNLGGVLQELRRFDDALDARQNALDIFRDLGDHHSQAMAWGGLGGVLQELRRFDDALDAHQNALDLHHDLGDHHSQAMAWGNLGGVLQELRRFDDALTAHQNALDLHHDLGDHHR